MYSLPYYISPLSGIYVLNDGTKMDRPISSSASLPTLSPNVKNEKNEKSERLECTCKYLQLNLSTTTAAEYGDLNSLTHRLSSSHNNNRNNIKITPGNTPLHLSAQHGHVAMTSYLLENGYDPNTGLLVSQSSAVVPKQDDKDRYTATPTPIHRACHSGALGCIQLLLQAHADILIPDFSFGDGMNAMHKAVKGGTNGYNFNVIFIYLLGMHALYLYILLSS